MYVASRASSEVRNAVTVPASRELAYSTLPSGLNAKPLAAGPTVSVSTTLLEAASITNNCPLAVDAYTRWPLGATVMLNPELVSGIVVVMVFEARSMTATALPNCSTT